MALIFFQVTKKEDYLENKLFFSVAWYFFLHFRHIKILQSGHLVYYYSHFWISLF